MEYKINLSDNDLKYMDEPTGDIVLDCSHLPDGVTVGDVIIIHYSEDKDSVSHVYTVDHLDTDNNVATLCWERKTESELMVEEPVIKLNDNELNNPAAVDFKSIAKNAKDEEDAQIAKQEFDKRTESIRNKNQHIVDYLNDALRREDQTLVIVDKMFDALVPPSGMSETVAGEYIRAIVRILYRDANDGDKFFEGYGIDTCGSSAEYLYDNGFDAEIRDILDNAYYLSSEDEKYTEKLVHLTKTILEDISNTPELCWTPNETDSRNYSIDLIVSEQPRYDFDFEVSDKVEQLLEQGTINAWDVNKYVEEQFSNDSVFNGAEVERPWSQYSSTVTVTNLTKDGYDTLSDMLDRHFDSFWEDLVSEYADELNSSEDDDFVDLDDYSDDSEDSM